MSAPDSFDICVVGAGSAGLTTAAAARAVGFSVALIEKGEMGGECLNTGCVPSKALIAAARHAHAVTRARAFGIDTAPPSTDYGRVHAHVHEVIGQIAPHDSQARFEGLGATVIRAPARFLDDRTVEAGGRRIRAKRFVIATGSRPALPPIAGLDGVPYLTNESLFDLTDLPRHLVIVGAGAVALEMAQAFRRLGSDVTVLVRSRVLGHDDPDCAAIVERRLAAEGVRFRQSASAVRVAYRDGEIAVTVKDPAGEADIVASHILVATGRRPAVEGLGLEAAGISHDGEGIRTDGAMRTSNRRVYAIGDVAASYRFTHWAGYQGGLVVRSILSHVPARENRDAIVWATYTDPEIAHVGLGEAEARARHGSAVRVLTAPYSGNDRAIADRDGDGLLKIVVGRRNRVVGADIAGPGAGETAALFALAISGRLGIGDFAGAVLPYPTLAEAARRAAVSGYAAQLERPLVARALALLRGLLR